MADLAAIVRATRASARALQAATIALRQYEAAMKSGDLLAEAKWGNHRRRALQRFYAAQAILAANPLPGDK